MIARLIVSGGGTGGHLFPGIAVVEELRRRTASLEVLFVGTERGIEARVLPPMGEKLTLMRVDPLVGGGVRRVMQSLSGIPSAMGHAMQILRDFQPDLVIGLGGYASGPIVAAASMMGIRTALLEQNVKVGLTNRLLARFVGRAYVSSADTAKEFPRQRVRVVGNPVRRAFVRLARAAMADPEGFEARANQILVLGGSQGAKVFNSVVPKALKLAGLENSGLTVLHQTGASMKEEVEALYRNEGVKAEVVPFVDDMARAFASSALVISRAGATTVAELCAVGRPSILIPYPFSAEGHQESLAAQMEQARASEMIPEASLTIENLGARVTQLIASPQKRRGMTEAARRLGHPEAAAAIVDDLIAWMGCEGSMNPDDVAEAESHDYPSREDTGVRHRAHIRGFVPRRPIVHCELTA